MPLVIGDITANITVLPAPKPGDTPPLELRASEQERISTISAIRLEAERQIDQRDPDLLGGR